MTYNSVLEERSSFKVSVIIPVYNAAKFVRKAVESAVTLNEVGEVLLVEDGSTDTSLIVCEQLQKEYPKIKLYRHKNGKNRGVSASRNLGIEKASCDFIAFLDADDYYLPNRFRNEEELFKTDVDGVYSAALTLSSLDTTFRHIQSVKKAVKPERLPYYLIRGTYGHFCTNGITLRKKLLRKLGGFKSHLALHEDTELWLRCAFKGKLVAGSIIEPTSIVVSHGNNTIIGRSNKSRIIYLTELMRELPLSEIGLLNYILLVRKAVKNVSDIRDIYDIVSSFRLFKNSL